MEILYWILISVGIVVSILAVIAVIGMTMPKSHQVSRSITLKQTPDAVWQTITDFANVTSWNENVLKMEKQPDKNGNELWKETYKGNYGLFLETTEATPPTRLVRTIADEKGPFSGRWEFALSANGGGCKLTITEFGDVPNPFFRFMFRMFMKPEVYVEMYLTALAKKFGEQPVYV